MKFLKLLSLVTVVLSITILTSCDFKANKAYKEAIEMADASFENKKYKDAKASYKKASEIKPEETYPKEKIAEIDKYFANKRAKTYKSHIKKADELLGQEKYNEAKNFYAKASKIKPKEKYPKDKIAEINKKLEEIEFQEVYMKYKYHIVVGCFMEKNNATRLNKKLMDEGHKSRIITLPNGRFDAVTYASFPTLKDGVAGLAEAKGLFGEEVWVMKH